MVIAKDVKRPDNPDGFPVCGIGTVLSDPVIERLKQMGVQSITVKGMPVNMEGEASVEGRLAALERRFRKISGDPLMIMVKEKFQNYIIRSGKGCNGRR